MDINRTLKFSWGHIIAFVAVIFISYISFMGLVYLMSNVSGIDDYIFILAGVGVLVIDLVLITFFIIPQILKGTEEKFSKRIGFERMLIFTAPIFFILAMIPYSHFWHVFENRARVENTFSESINSAQYIFRNYDDYAKSRIEDYVQKLHSRRNVKVQALEAQLKGRNYTQLKEDATYWLENAQTASVWNIFTIGNIGTITEAIGKWDKTLEVFSHHKMINEYVYIRPFHDPNTETIINDLNSLKEAYSDFEWQPTMVAIVIGFVLYILLMLPYVIQRRNTKSTFRLIGSENSHYLKDDSNIAIKLDEKDDHSASNDDKYGSFTM